MCRLAYLRFPLFLIGISASAELNDLGAQEPSAASAEDLADQRMPPPLDSISYDLGTLAEHFTIVDCQYKAADEFKVGDRVVAEETVCWTLKASRALKGDAVYHLLHPHPFPSPFAKVRFEKTADGKSVSADARPSGYHLIGDLRWFRLQESPDLAAGDELQVWTHLGKEGSAGLLANKAAKMVVVVPQ